MSVDKERLKLSLRIDSNFDDELLDMYLSAASDFIKNAVGAPDDFYINNDLFDTAVVALASSYYTNRTALSNTQTYTINMTLNSIIGQLRGQWSEESENEEHQSSKNDV